MATTIDNATLTVTVNEDIKLNGQQVGSKIVQAIAGINEASRRVLSVPTYETEILALSSSAGGGTYVTSNLKYIRVSNMDDTNFVRITFVSGSSNRYDMKLPAKRTAIFTSPSISGSDGGAGFGSFVSFDSMKATADTSSVDLELFVAST
jgi:hypothetical protein|tara:strand:+ start:3210 stop:3659 length:450 start_codon:yes stop_codon:yes gene_type:complete